MSSQSNIKYLGRSQAIGTILSVKLFSKSAYLLFATIVLLLVTLSSALAGANSDSTFDAQKFWQQQQCSQLLLPAPQRRTPRYPIFRYNDRLPDFNMPSREALLAQMAKNPESVIELIARLGQNYTGARDALREAMRHPLTKLYNRTSYEKIIPEMLAFSDKYRTPLIFIAMDLNKFKQVNDRLSHQVGDTLLTGFAVVFSEALQSLRDDTDFLFHIGGDEFLLVMQDADIETAEKVAKRISQKLRQHPILREVADDILHRAYQNTPEGEDARQELEKSLGPNWNELARRNYIGSLSYGIAVRHFGQPASQIKEISERELENFKSRRQRMSVEQILNEI